MLLLVDVVRRRLTDELSLVDVVSDYNKSHLSGWNKPDCNESKKRRELDAVNIDSSEEALF